MKRDRRPIQHIYVDTFYFQSFLLAKTELEISAKDEFNSVWSKSGKHNGFKLVIPFVVIGEAINNLKKKNAYQREEVLINLGLAKIMTDDHIDFKPATHDVLDLAKRIREKDDRIDPTDLMIVAQSLCDPESLLLLTNDEKIITSSGITEVNTECCDQGWRKKLKIKDTFS